MVSQGSADLGKCVQCKRQIPHNESFSIGPDQHLYCICCGAKQGLTSYVYCAVCRVLVQMGHAKRNRHYRFCCATCVRPEEDDALDKDGACDEADEDRQLLIDLNEGLQSRIDQNEDWQSYIEYHRDHGES